MAPYTIWVAKRATGSAMSLHQHAAPHARPFSTDMGAGGPFTSAYVFGALWPSGHSQRLGFLI
jgi:hypothetical protein